MFFSASWEGPLTKLLVKLIDGQDKQVGAVELDDRQRKAHIEYDRRSIIWKGRKFQEPEAAALEFMNQDEWHEVLA